MKRHDQKVLNQQLLAVCTGPFAFKYADEACIRATNLIAQGAQVNSGRLRRTPLNRACRAATVVAAGNLALVRLLLDHGANAQHALRFVLTAYWPFYFNFELFKLLLDHGRCNVNYTYCPGSTVLSLAVMFERIEAVELLIEKGARVDDPQSPPLMRVEVRDRSKIAVPMARLLLENGADPNAGLNDRWPLFRAVSHNHVEVARLLLEHGASVDVYGKDGRSPLECAVSRHPGLGKKKMIKLLLNHKSDNFSYDDD